jgi:hypothetical protein
LKKSQGRKRLISNLTELSQPSRAKSPTLESKRSNAAEARQKFNPRVLLFNDFKSPPHRIDHQGMPYIFSDQPHPLERVSQDLIKVLDLRDTGPALLIVVVLERKSAQLRFQLGGQIVTLTELVDQIPPSVDTLILEVILTVFHDQNVATLLDQLRKSIETENWVILTYQKAFKGRLALWMGLTSLQSLCSHEQSEQLDCYRCINTRLQSAFYEPGSVIVTFDSIVSFFQAHAFDDRYFVDTKDSRDDSESSHLTLLKLPASSRLLGELVHEALAIANVEPLVPSADIRPAPVPDSPASFSLKLTTASAVPNSDSTTSSSLKSLTAPTKASMEASAAPPIRQKGCFFFPGIPLDMQASRPNDSRPFTRFFELLMGVKSSLAKSFHSMLFNAIVTLPRTKIRQILERAQVVLSSLSRDSQDLNFYFPYHQLDEFVKLATAPQVRVF